MQATILDLRRRMPEVLRALDRQGQVTILHRGKERAILVAAGGSKIGGKSGKARRSVSDHPAFGMWADRADAADVPAQVRALRRGRGHAL